MKVRVCGKNSIPFFHVDQAINLPSVQPIFRFNKKCKETRIQIDNTDICRVSQKKVWFTAPGAKVYLFCATLLYGIFFENYFFFWYSNGPKKNLRAFFFIKSKVKKSKISVQKHYNTANQNNSVIIVILLF